LTFPPGACFIYVAVAPQPGARRDSSITADNLPHRTSFGLHAHWLWAESACLPRGAMDEPWIAPLDAGQPEAAWDAFIGRYRRLIFAGIRHYAQDYDDVMEVFARVCEALREDDFRRLRTYAAQPVHQARFSTWLVTVVRHLTVDWFRQRDGRRRLPAVAEGLPPLQRRIFEHVFLAGRSHVEAFELIRAREAPTMTFRAFLAELRAVYKAVTKGRRGMLLPELTQAPPPESDAEAPASDESAEWTALVEQGLASLGPEDRVAVELFVLEELPAGDVARIVGLPNAKAVYNRVYRALALLRKQLEAAGVRREDL
jgi:RNA polymerase sigma factor (sigma-70 family)